MGARGWGWGVDGEREGVVEGGGGRVLKNEGYGGVSRVDMSEFCSATESRAGVGNIVTLQIQ